MPDVRQLNLLDGFHTGTAQLDGDRFTVRTIETEETATGYVVRFRDGRGPEARLAESVVERLDHPDNHQHLDPAVLAAEPPPPVQKPIRTTSEGNLF